MPKPFSKKNNSGTIAGRIRGVHTFPNNICPKVNVVTRLEFELTFYYSAVHRSNHYTTMTPPPPIWLDKVLWPLNHCWLSNANPLCTYILNIYDLVWLGFMAYQPV